MRILCAALLAAGLATAGAPAETTQQKGKRLVDEALAALGGPAYLHMRNRVETGRIYGFYNEDITGLAVDTLYTTYLPRPDPPDPGLVAERIRDARGTKRDDVLLYSNESGYEITFRGARPLSETVMKQFRTATLHNVFYILRQRLGEPGLILESRGGDFFENRPVELVDITDKNNETVTAYFDQSTKLPTKQVYYRRDPVDNTRLEEVSIFSKYRDVGGGVMWPFTLRRERNGEKVFEMYSESVEINQDLADSLFNLPPNLKILKKEK